MAVDGGGDDDDDDAELASHQIKHSKNQQIQTIARTRLDPTLQVRCQAFGLGELWRKGATPTGSLH